MIVDDSRCMIVGGQMEACTLTIIDYHEPFDQGLIISSGKSRGGALEAPSPSYF